MFRVRLNRKVEDDETQKKFAFCILKRFNIVSIIYVYFVHLLSEKYAIKI